ncbi:hypothetical protein F1D05_18320 [Kribbella qitaiheensis]|uniref:Transposase n=1 Tax=Kribbella qitaiheensis TaxID=1544730 RepID=A0A7G6WZU6_9ACTN|nr:hypothetical protein F1D05_18320 [Kribbella qitaiheensis]
MTTVIEPPSTRRPRGRSSIRAVSPEKGFGLRLKFLWRIEHEYRELKTGVGLDHFEGRSWTGWHPRVPAKSRFSWSGAG